MDERKAKLKEWRDNPLLFVAEAFGVITDEDWCAAGMPEDVEHQELWQQNALIALRDKDRISIRSGKGVGKTTFLAWAILWFVSTRHEVKIPCTATSGHQLHDILWKECAKWINRIKPEYKAFLPIEKKKDTIVLVGAEESNFAVARTARREQPEAFQGFHAENLLLVADEASGIDDAIFEAGEGAMSTKGAKIILTGNPTRPKGYFYDTFHKDRGRWHNIKVSCFDSRRVTQRYIDEQLAKWGEDSNAYRIGVLGEFPLGTSDAVVPLYLVEDAVGRDIVDPNAPEIWGLDVARFGNDRCALAKRQGRKLLEKIQWWQGKDAMETCGIVADQYFALRADRRPMEILVDVLGMGGAFVDRLKEIGLPARGVNVVQRKGVDREYLRLGDQLWFRVRDWFQAQDTTIPDDPDFISEITSVGFTFNSDGKRYIPDKHEGGPSNSPDLADAFVLTFATNFRERPLTTLAKRNIQQYAIADASYVGEN